MRANGSARRHAIATYRNPGSATCIAMYQPAKLSRYSTVCSQSPHSVRRALDTANASTRRGNVGARPRVGTEAHTDDAEDIARTGDRHVERHSGG